MLFWLKLAGLFLLGLAVLWWLFAWASKASQAIRKQRGDE